MNFSHRTLIQDAFCNDLYSLTVLLVLCRGSFWRVEEKNCVQEAAILYIVLFIWYILKEVLDFYMELIYLYSIHQYHKSDEIFQILNLFNFDTVFYSKLKYSLCCRNCPRTESVLAPRSGPLLSRWAKLFFHMLQSQQLLLSPCKDYTPHCKANEERT